MRPACGSFAISSKCLPAAVDDGNFSDQEVIEVALSACCRYPRTGERSSAVKFRLFIPREDVPQFVDYDWLEDQSIKAAEGIMRALLREGTDV